MLGDWTEPEHQTQQSLSNQSTSIVDLEDLVFTEDFDTVVISHALLRSFPDLVTNFTVSSTTVHGTLHHVLPLYLSLAVPLYNQQSDTDQVLMENN